ncbi:MAG TPA: cellulase family glycosylhydrolase [Thermoleophilaceae bacterium]|nr:cellulase family glycosylhydrolase [Thermoleophilaceae bacterium]
MRIRLIALLALLVAPASALGATPPGHAGRWITDPQGRVLLPHGLNMVNKLKPYAPASTGFGDDDARFLARNGLNIVRLGVMYTAVEPQPGRYDDAYLAGIAKTVATLGRHGIYTLLDFHQDQYNERFQGEGFPDWSVQDDNLPATPKNGFPLNYPTMPALQHAFDHLWANSPGPGGVGLADRFASAWQHVAARFNGNADVIGYDLFNEPWPGTTWAPCATAAGCPAFDATLAAFQKRVIAAIRRSDRRHLVFYEPNVLFNFGNPTHLPDLGDARAGMSFHEYCDASTGRSCPRKVLAGALSHVRTTGDALLLSEWGSVDTKSTLGQLPQVADAQLVPWIEWAYCGCGDPTGSIPPSTEALVLDPARAPSGANVKSAKLTALARPHPGAVAGTPLKLSFSTSSRRLSFSWSTSRAAGHGSFAAGSCTSVFLPPTIYPRGYRVSVTGARVASKTTAGLLELDSLPGAKRVSLRVTPARGGHTSAPGAASGCSAR